MEDLTSIFIINYQKGNRMRIFMETEFIFSFPLKS